MSVNKINNDGTLSPMAGTPVLKLNGIQDNINKNGSKNILPNRGTSYTAGNLTLTKNTDGSVTLNGTNNTGSTVWWKFAEDIVWGSEDKSWEINGFPNEHTYNGYTFSLDGDSSVTIGTGLFYFGFTVANSTTWLGINTGASFSNLTVYPMVRLASDSDSTYQPYAMTNREMTDAKHQTIALSDTWGNGSFHYHKCGRIVNIYFDFTLSTDASNVQISDIPVGLRPCYDMTMSTMPHGELTYAPAGALSFRADGRINMYMGQSGKRYFSIVTYISE